MSPPKTLRFGIQSLDRLIGTIKPNEIYGIDVSEPEESVSQKRSDGGSLPITSSVCLAGPDGTGKSILCLHMASHYLADRLAECVDIRTDESCPRLRVLYISTDLTYKMALKGWNHFALNHPLQRREPLVELKKGREERQGAQIEIALKQYFPSGEGNSAKSIINYLEGDAHTLDSDPVKAEVGFVDLASRTAGDDWGFVHRLLSTLEEPRRNDPRHLVVLDAVEGFETLVGDLNAFGEKSSRRSRIAQVMRLTAGKCHLLLVVEEGHEERYPEEFVTDVVIRLRNVETGRYLRRTVEIEKARGQWHRRGQHPYVIRDGRGSTTGTQTNADDPKVFRDNPGKEYQSYVHVFPSLDYTSREIMIDKYNPREIPAKARFAAFGIPFLDNMLGGSGEKAERELDSEGDYDTRGLPCGSATALLGDSLTQKSQLGKAFLSRAFYSYAKELSDETKQLDKSMNSAAVKHHVQELSQKICKRFAGSNPVTLLFTTQDLNHESLADEFYQWLRDDENIFGRDHMSPAIGTAFENEVKAHIKNHTICRRFEIHDLPAPTLINIFQRSIESAQRIMLGREDSQPLPPPNVRFQDSWRIRVVIDDLNGVRNTYLEVRDDPLLLPSLLFMFGREGVTSLIIDTQSSGSPELPITERFDSSVRELVQTRIYTWRLPFYGENRVAISVIPPISHEYRGLIRELHWETRDENKMDRALTVDPHFELYMGLEKAQPQPVPLEVRLYADTPSVEKYIATEEKLLREVFTPVRRKNDESRVIAPAAVNEYEALRDACHLQRDTKLDHTTILQVNEFWWLRRPRQRRAGAFRPQWNYLNSVTATLKDEEYCSETVVDPFWVFQPAPSKKAGSASENGSRIARPHREREVKRRRDFFDEDCGYDLLGIRGEAQQSVDRVPYTWDFGFLLCNGYAWEEALKLDIGKDSIGREIKVRDVWKRLYKATEDGRANAKNSITPKGVSWREFLAASKIVAEFQSYRTSAAATAFDFTMLIPESFSCLILEMWISESYDCLEKYKERSGGNAKKRKGFEERKKLLQRVSKRQWYPDTRNPVTLLGGLEEEEGQSLTTILDERKRTHEIQSFSLELYKVWLLLTEAINFAELVDSSSHLNFEFKSRDVSPQAVSARHWYKTASKFIDSLRPEQLEYNWVPVRLPGHFSVRADWFLAVAGGSRSSRLADHALDLLSSQRSNVTRLQEGIGLPTRRLFDSDGSASHLRTRLVAAPKKGKPLANVEYDLLKRIGAGTKSSKEFYWLWRSGIWTYNRHSRVWHKWLNRALLWWHSWHQRYGSNWKNGFDVYDLLTKIEFGDDKEYRKSSQELKDLKLESWKEFHRLRDILIAELKQVSISTV